jgi:glycosyltransferase involved in cell wall biosynthesis
MTGGAERQARLQAEALARRGHAVTVVCPRQRGQPMQTTLAGFEVRRVGYPALPASRVWYVVTLLAFVLLNVRRFDVVHVHALRLPSNLAACRALVMRRPVYVKIAAAGAQGEVAYWARGWRRRLGVLPHASRVQALTDEIAAQLASAGVSRDRIVLIPNGIDLRRFSSVDAETKLQRRRRLRLPVEGVVALYCGSFQPLKGTPDLLEAWARLEPSKATLVLVGNAANGYRVAATSNVIVRPWQDEIAPYYEAADVFVLPSRAEGMSNALLEALASGLAVIATSVGAAEALIAHGEHGLLVAPSDVPALATALREVIEDAALRSRLASRAPEAISALGIDGVTAQIERAYADMYARK